MSVWVPAYAETLQNFRRVFVSSDMGIRKPEPEAFAMIAAAIGVPLPRILFFDDTAENVQGAMAVGMQAVHLPAGHGVADAIANSVRALQP
jgi:putative hydrolase of the HAD superfamily